VGENIIVKNGYFETLSMSRNVLSDILSKDLPIKIGYWIARIFDKMESESKSYFKAKELLIKKYAKKDEKDEFVLQNGNYMIDNIDVYTGDLSELQDIDVTIPLNPIEIDLDLLESKNITFKPIEIMIMPFIKLK